MIKKSYREIIFFVVMFCLAFLSLKYAVMKIEMSRTEIYIFTALIFTGVMVGIFFAASLNESSENFWDVSPAALCKGGPYMWQGDSETAKMCRAMADSKDGRCSIASYNCPTGYIGTPKIPFYYSPLSDDNWKNERCGGGPEECGCSGNTLDGFDRRVPFDTSTSDD